MAAPFNQDHESLVYEPAAIHKDLLLWLNRKLISPDPGMNSHRGLRKLLTPEICENFLTNGERVLRKLLTHMEQLLPRRF